MAKSMDERLTDKLRDLIGNLYLQKVKLEAENEAQAELIAELQRPAVVASTSEGPG
jgi:hypothetical protein